MLQKATYEVFQDRSAGNGRGEYMLKIKASLNNRSTSIPTNIFVTNYQFHDQEVIEHSQAKGLNAMINKYIMELQDIEIDAFKRDVDLTLPMLYSMYVEKLNATTPITEFCDHVMKYSTGRKAITKQKYYDVVKEIDRFHKGVCLEDIDIVWLKKYETARLNEGVAESTLWSNMKVLRALFNEAIKRDLLRPNQNPFRLYEIPEARYRTDVLSFSEIEEFELMGIKSGNDRRVRDIFCFAAYTGLRWSDLKRLKKDNITTTGGVTWLKMNTQKTGAYAQIPLSIIFFGNALRILDKYGSVEEMMKYACNSSVNRELRRILKTAGIGGGQRISMHTARRSCITGLADFGVPIQTIKKIAGHSRISTTSKYLVLSIGMIQKDLEAAFSKDVSNKFVHIEVEKQIIKVTPSGKKLFAGSEIMRCKNCSFFCKRRCKLFKKPKTNEDWCDSFSERLPGEPDNF